MNTVYGFILYAYVFAFPDATTSERSTSTVCTKELGKKRKVFIDNAVKGGER